jgi:glutamate synthase (NADPH/NADH) small chain
MPADLVLLAMGFVHPVQSGLLEGLGVGLDPRGNVRADTQAFATTEPGVFAAGDCRRGQSLVVWAQWEGREAARAADLYLSGSSQLQTRNAFV